MRKPRPSPPSIGPMGHYISAIEIQRELGVSRAQAYRLMKTMRHVSFGGNVRVAREDFEAWVRGRHHGFNGESVPSNDVGPFVYFVEADGFIKVGWCRAHPRGRLSKLQTGSPHILTLVAAVPGGVHLEERIHAALREHHHRGEWFRDCAAVRDYIANLVVDGSRTDLRTEVATTDETIRLN